jgi:hypothetical protein
VLFQIDQAIKAANENANDTLIHIILGAFTAWFTVEKGYAYFLRVRGGSPKPQFHRTFADDPEVYWDRMRQNVTEPLSKILDRQTEIIEKQVEGNSAVMLRLVAIDERSKRR